MKLFFKGLELVLDANDTREEKIGKSAEFLFDDEPLEGILYRKNLDSPTWANLFLPGLAEN